MIKKISNYIEKNHIIQPHEKVVVGISGGADSVCLLLVLHKLSETLNLEIQPVHINHNLRGDDAKKDQEFTVEFCKSLGYQCAVESVDIVEVAKESKVSTEEAGRNERRRILTQYASKSPNTKITLGHHMDDNVETCIFNLCRGTGIRGLAGIEPVAGQIIRPLLAVKRQDIEAYLKEQGQSYCVDTSNLTDDYTRNKIRHKVVPLLKSEINDRSLEHMNETMQELREITSYLEEDIQKTYELYVIGDDHGLELSQQLLDIKSLIARGVIKKALGHMLDSHRDISRNHIMAVYELFHLQVGRKINLPGDLIAYRTYGGISLSFTNRACKTQECSCIELEIPGQTILNDGRVIETEILVYNGLETFHENHYTKYFDYDIIGDKLFVDMARDSDYFVINEKGNTQSLKKYAKNEKIPSTKRNKLLSIRSREEIQWLFDYRVGFKTRVSTDTKSILKIQIGGEDHGR